jgi:uncharacterized membrane protein YedE/YeeE
MEINNWTDTITKYYINNKENRVPRKISWWQGGILMSFVVLFTFSIFGANRPLGCSTSIPYFSSEIFGLEDLEYAQKSVSSGSWQVVLLFGALVGGLLTSLFITKSFGFKAVPTLWRERKGGSVLKRFFWSFVGGFMIVFGARLAGGCTSGHLLSGLPQMAVSGMIFGFTMMIALFITGYFFYKD